VLLVPSPSSSASPTRAPGSPPSPSSSSSPSSTPSSSAPPSSPATTPSKPPATHLTLNPLPGLYGFLLSPQKAIWWHYPLILPALLGLPAFARSHPRELRFLALAAALYFLPLCTIESWAGEWSYGPRYLLPGLPLLSLPALLALRSSTPVRATTILLLAASLWLNFQVNRLEFFSANRLRNPLQLPEIPFTKDGWPDDNAPYTARSYFDHRTWGLITHDLIATKGDAEKLPLWPLAQSLPPDRLESLRADTATLYQRSNWFWFATRNKP